MSDIKSDYDRADEQAKTSQERYENEFDSLAREYQFKRVELRGANRQFRRAEQMGQHDQIVRWVARAEHIQRNVMPNIMVKLELLHGEMERDANVLKELRMEISVAAGISDGFGDDIKVVDDPRGGFSIYFGGIGLPDGPGHAHYVYNADFQPRYRREPERTQPLPRWRR
ncbi:MAG: hypothetical protein NVSMB39_2940 [Candidatus Saccharimonadales bacterium]